MQKKNRQDIPWVEKYRPTSLNDVSSQSLTIQSLQKFVKNESIPHLIFAGPAGTGKTSTAIAMINDLLGPENLTLDTILERNASDESRMRDLPSIKNFVNHTGITEKKRFKFVILDEADNLSRDVQSAFRRIIEMAPANVKFIFMCNYVERIIDPILSRCAIFRFYPLPKQAFETQIMRIAKLEKIPVDTQVMNALFYISQGDMRQAINLFQMVAALLEDEQGNVHASPINPDIIYTISGFIPPAQFTQLFSYLTRKEFKPMIEILKELRSASSRGMLRQLTTTILENAPKYLHPLLEELLVTIGEYDYRLTLNADPILQIDGLFAELIQKQPN